MFQTQPKSAKDRFSPWPSDPLPKTEPMELTNRMVWTADKRNDKWEFEIAILLRYLFYRFLLYLISSCAIKRKNQIWLKDNEGSIRIICGQTSVNLGKGHEPPSLFLTRCWVSRLLLALLTLGSAWWSGNKQYRKQYRRRSEWWGHKWQWKEVSGLPTLSWAWLRVLVGGRWVLPSGRYLGSNYL